MESFHGRMINQGQKVRVYVNLHRKGKFSIVDMKTGLVCGYVTSCLLKSAHFHASSLGREKVRRTGQRMVHAWVRGVYLGSDIPKPENMNKELSYNPYLHEGFVAVNGEIINEADGAFLSNKRVYI